MPQYIGSTTPLAGNGTYTSNWVTTNTWASITGSVFADQAGTLYIEQSGDQSHADVSNSTAVTASTGVGFNQAILLPYVRLRYVNGASAQGTLRLIPRFVLGNGT